MPETNICQYWPPWFRRILDFQALCQTEGQELEFLAQAMAQIRDNLFVQTMDEGTTAQWEAILRILPEASDTLDFRRLRVLNRIALRPPFTLTFLYRKLDILFGPGEWAVEVDYPNYTLYIEASANAQPYFAEVSALLNIVKPCHITYISRPRLDHVLLLSEQTDRIEIEYNYILGAWNLGEKPFVSVTELEVLKMAAQESIQQPLLDHTAKFAASDVASARVNGEVVITALTRSASGSEAYVSYPVRKDQAAQVDQVELLDQDGNVLTSSAVYLPLLEDQIQLRHKFIVKEGV